MGVDTASREFHHPYQPYPIQVDFMNAVYDCIQNRQVGIFESPTGTVSLTPFANVHYGSFPTLLPSLPQIIEWFHL